jgi:hypothetical protein
MAATIGPKAPRNVAGTGSDEITPRASSAAGTHNAQVNAKANAKYFSGKVLVVVRGGVAVAVVISGSPLFGSVLWERIFVGSCLTLV